MIKDNELGDNPKNDENYTSLISDFSAIIRLLKSKLVTIFIVTSIFAVSAIFYSLSVEEKWVADISVKPVGDAQSSSGSLGSLGGIASLAGINLRGKTANDPLPIMQSRDFSGQFIIEEGILNRLSALQGDDGNPDIRLAVKEFSQSVIKFDRDERSGIITISIKWNNSEKAAYLANKYIDRLNYEMRSKAVQEGEINLKYLTEELKKTNNVSIQESLSLLMQSEYEKIMIAKGKTYYALEIIDKAVAPIKRSEPKRALIVISVTTLGFIITVVFIFLKAIFRDEKLSY